MRKFVLLPFFYVLTSSVFSQSQSVIPAVVVKAKKNMTLTSSHGSKTVITAAQMSALGISSVSQALQELGGIQLQDTTGNGSQVLLSMRGFGANASSNTLLLINGIPVTNPDIAPPDLNTIPLQDIQSIEVVAGSESVLYGDQAVGGTVNIITRGKTKKQIDTGCSGGSYNQHNCYITLNRTTKHFDVSLGVATTHTDNYRQQNEYGQNLLSGRINHPYSTGNTGFNFQIANERMQYPGALTAEEVRQNRRQANNDTNFFRDWNGIFHLQNQQQINSKWTAETDFARREMHGDGVLFSEFTQSRTVNYLRPQFKGTVKKALVISGIELEDDNYNLNTLFGVTNDSLQKYGIFGLTNIPITPTISLSLGARGAQQNNSLKNPTITNTINHALATTLGASFQMNANTQLYLRRAESFRFPKADENASTPPGIKGLKTQRGVSYETGVQWNWKKLISKLGIYQLNLKDEIQFDPTQTPEDPFGVNINLDPTVRQGAFLTEKYHVNDKLTLSGQYNFVLAKFQSGIYAGKYIPLVSENILRAGIIFKFYPHWNLYSEAIYTGGQYADNDNANIAGKIGGYTVFNFSLGYHFRNFSASFRVNNLFNKYYYYYTVYQPSLQSQFFYPSPGRNFLLNLKCDIS